MIVHVLMPLKGIFIEKPFSPRMLSDEIRTWLPAMEHLPKSIGHQPFCLRATSFTVQPVINIPAFIGYSMSFMHLFFSHPGKISSMITSQFSLPGNRSVGRRALQHKCHPRVALPVNHLKYYKK